MYCEECGTQIVPVDRMATQSIRRVSTSSLRSSLAAAYPGELPAGPSSVANLAPSLYLVDAGEVILLEGQNEFVLGRAVEGQARRPDIDLSPFGAFSQGVSRLHAAVRVAGPRVSILDLGSSNGTRINGQKLNPHAEFTLHHGDMIALGKLKIQFLVRK